MARLTNVYRTEDTNYMNNINIGRRQIPVIAGDNLMMLMDLNSKGLCIDCPTMRGRELEEFARKYNLLSESELRESLEIDSATFMSVLNQCVQCVGCRRRVERLFNQLALSGHATLDPLVLKSTKVLTINEERLKTPQALGTLLYRHHDVLNNLLDSKLRNKTRCLLHSLDAFRSKPFSETWREVWSSMKHNCRDELAVIETKELQEVLENYLKKHKFCQGCRTKIEKAYKILVGESTTKEKGFVAALYANFEKCHPDKHIHVFTNKIDFLDALIRRAEPEVNGSYSKLRERHAKTLEIAQEEVLTCVGMIMYERLRRIYINLREEERACQVLAAVGVHALCRSFDTSVEKKQGISNLELLYQEISRAEKAKEHRREQKKLKKKKKKIEKRNGYRMCEVSKTTATTEDSGSEGTREVDDEEHDPNYYDDDDEDEDIEDEAVDVSEECSVEQHVNALATANQHDEEDEDIYEGASLESNSDATEEEHDKANIDAEPCQAQKQISKKKKRSKQKKSKKFTTANNDQNGKKSVSLSSSPVHDAKFKQNAVKCVSPLRALDLNVVRHGLTVDLNKCSDCLESTQHCPCENDIKDSGYGSEPNSSHDHSRVGSELSSPEGSEISCSDGFCNHEHTNTGNGCIIRKNVSCNGGLSVGFIGTHEKQHDAEQRCENDGCESLLCQERRMHLLSLEQMLDDVDCYEGEDTENCYIPQEVVLEYQCQREQVEKQRQKLRETLRQNFARLCKQGGAGVTVDTIRLGSNMAKASALGCN